MGVIHDDLELSYLGEQGRCTIGPLTNGGGYYTVKGSQYFDKLALDHMSEEDL